MAGAAGRSHTSAGYGKGTGTSCFFSLFNLIFKLKLFLFFFTSGLELPRVVSCCFGFFLVCYEPAAVPWREGSRSSAGSPEPQQAKTASLGWLYLAQLEPFPFLPGTGRGAGKQGPMAGRRNAHVTNWQACQAPASSETTAGH